MSFLTAYEPASVVLVGHAFGALTDDELFNFGKALKQLDADAISSRRVPATLLFVTLTGEAPSAKQRKMMADLWLPVRAPLHLFALASTSSVARGVVKIVQWLNPPGAHRRESVHPTFEAAARWLESERSEPLPALPRLFAQVSGMQPMRAAR